MKLIFSHPTGNANVRAAAEGFMEANMLQALFTTIASFPGDILDGLGALGLLSEIRKRRFDSSLRSVTKVRPWRELGRHAASKAGIHKLVEHEVGLFCIDAVYRDLDKHVAQYLKNSSACRPRSIYAYEDGAAASFREAKKMGVRCLYDLPTGHWRAARRYLETEKERWPEWIATMTGLQDSEEKLARKDEELRLADRILVASRFTANTLKSYPGEIAPIDVVPYGFPPVTSNRSYTRIAPNRPIKLLFVGKLSQQKGIADVFSAVKALGNHVELTLVGHRPTTNCPALNEALSMYKWTPSLPHEKILHLMREHDVLLFPSLFDGFGLVITEAMAQGTPVIASDRSAGPELITHGQDGWIIEAGSTTALHGVLEELVLQPELIADAGQGALKTAGKRNWEVYKKELLNSVSMVNEQQL